MRKKSGELTKNILFLLAGGVLLTAAFIAPNIAQLAKPLIEMYKDTNKYELKRRKQALARLRKRKLIDFFQKGDETFVCITKEGKAHITKYDLEKLSFKKHQKWDGFWRVIIFDIPEFKKKARDALRYQFRRLDLYPIQKSVFIFPFDCEKEIDFVTGFFGVEKYIGYFLTKDLGNLEAKARDYFDLHDY